MPIRLSQWVARASLHDVMANRCLNDEDADVEDEWLKMKQYFMTCEEGHGGRVLCHRAASRVPQGFA